MLRVPRRPDHCDLAKREVGSPIAGVMRQCGDVLQVWPLHRGNLLECLPQRRLMATIAGQAVHAGQQKGRRKPFGSSS